MTCSGRGKEISSRPWVGVPSAGGRERKIPAKAEITRHHRKAVGLAQKTLFRGGDERNVS
ncbi:hypothetical protein ID854_20435 [Xenorhabdus sp. M]|uniref:Transposase n=1 Tax=Xenorhabdus szentirmaii TaxID=290112 RepID=A0AAW3Z0N2_9GAMM|nr:hypothetical protein [Xenorhabdus sp. M]MBD2802744.1 hypothetical protein [Xenorhabdus sp. M]